jgi:hypothetical protein
MARQQETALLNQKNMNFRNRKLVITARTILGLFIIFSGVGGLMMLASGDMSSVPPHMVAINDALIQSGIFQYVKVTEIIAGLLLVTGFLPALGALALVPVMGGVIIINALLTPEFLIFGIIVSLFVAYLGYAYWDKYKALFQR